MRLVAMPANARALVIFGAQHLADRSGSGKGLDAGDERQEPEGKWRGSLQPMLGIIIAPPEGGDIALSFKGAELAERMAALGAIICQAIVHHYGRDEFLRRLSHPFWFQSFGAVMGMDWHSSGITTSVIGALKRGLAPIGNELGIHVCGGRGKHSRRTPDELTALGDRIGVDALALTRASRLAAKVDSAALQDGFDLYLHGFF